MTKEKPHILIVDDEELNRDLLESMLELFSYQSMSAASGREALEILGAYQFDLVLLDVMMPGMDGFETAREIRQRFLVNDLPIIMVTALSSRDDRLKAVGCGVNDFITKPVDRTELKVRTGSQLKIKFMQDELKLYQSNLEGLILERTKELQQALEEAEASKEKILDAQRDTLRRLGVAAEFKDEDTADHIYRMSNYCEIIARGMGLPDEEVEMLLHASPMHDVGKIGIPDAILFKPGKLSPEEWQIMKEHAAIGKRILDKSNSSLLQVGALIAFTHHEKWDGSGYPRGMKGEDIPLYGRICAVADVFDALTSKRPYKNAFTNENSIQILKEGRGTHFDPNVLDIFLNRFEEVLQIQQKYR